MPSGSFHLPGFPPPTNNPWSQAPSSSNGNHGVSRGFSQPNHASNTYDNRQPFQHGIQGRQTPSDDANSQRVKRARPDEQPVNAMGSPPSPEIQRPGQRRRVTSLAESSDESVVDVTVANRLAHSRPVDVDTEQKFNRFKFTMPLEPANRVKAAWEESNGSAEKATKLLLDPSWSPRIRKALLAVAAAAPVDVAPAPKVETGRVKEVDEALQANRAAIREKGKKSLIYQSRPSVPDAIKSSPVKPAPSPIKRPSPPPESPIIINRARKRAKKVIDSDSDGAYGGSSDDEKGDTVDMRQISEARALSYLNTAGPAAIQELSGACFWIGAWILEVLMHVVRVHRGTS
jgi:SWI/SNF-related matrix-associated actin-dependent regulator 1 of chromatin subfamily A